ncbi:BgTH12-03128 [Blumeria graminis f. sp. triticale]|uniref:Mechanosensitive ion channel protein n=3 Tax=Blumeria graminis TaxID=34373 RepID=A0A061HGT5_BLUGR|nr:hypothetical protein BGT96224_1666 [Blumeria graminis f. sp. tritici 96224]CAD6503464.1 BgTH12-03128 [Blumeria graminis f. sp. triticale]VDB89556.1 Bgt-1666 [Blumeria graminis f. sp. tritici]
MAYENEAIIPLTRIVTPASSMGARKAGESTLNDFDQQDSFNDKEKSHYSGRRKAKNFGARPMHVETDGEEVELNHLGRIYDTIVNFSVITRYLVYVLPIALLLAIPIAIYAIFRPHDKVDRSDVPVYLVWAWVEIVWLSLWISKLLAKAVPRVFVTLCGVISSGTRKYAAILHAVEIQLSLVGWTLASLIIFKVFIISLPRKEPTQKHWLVIIMNILFSSLLASMLYLAEKMFVQLISFNYHRRSFYNRIKESKNSIRLLSYLYEASRTLFPTYCEEFRQEDYIINAPIKAKLDKVKQSRPTSASPLRLVGEIGRIGDKVTSAFGNMASEITGKQVFNVNSAQNVVNEALEKTKSSEALARRLWMSFVEEDHDSLYLDDIKEVLGQSRRDKAEECFAVLDTDGNGDISLDEMITKVVDIGRDSKAITASMRDVGQAIGVLDQVLVTILIVVVVFIYVAFQHTSFVTTLATAGTTLLSLSFVFAATTQEFLGSCIFLFVKHPYDVGDRCEINDISLVVEQISLLFTVFKRIDSMKMVQAPNIVLNTLWIENTSRSKAMKEQLELFISFDTSLEDIEILRTTMEAFVRHPDNSRDFQPDVIIETTSVNSMDKLTLRAEVRHKSNWHNETVRAARRSKFMCALVLALRKIPIYGPGGVSDALGGPSNPGYTVAVTDDWAAEARRKAEDERERSRLIPNPLKFTENIASKNQSEFTDGPQTAEPPHYPMRKDSTAIWIPGETENIPNNVQRSNSKQSTGMNSNPLCRKPTYGRRRPSERSGEPIRPPPQHRYSSRNPTPSNILNQNITRQTLDEESNNSPSVSQNERPKHLF